MEDKEDLKKYVDYEVYENHDVKGVGIENPNMDKASVITDKNGFRLDDTPVGMDYFENPNKDKLSAYTDEYGFRLGSFIDDKSKGRGR